MNKNKIIISSLIIFVILLIIFLTFFYYKKIKNGNTMINKSEEEILDYILNIKSYNAKMDITIETNKNQTKYVIKQEVNDKISKQEILEPENLSGVITEYDGKNLKLINNKLNLSTIFENYQYIANNKLWLDSFIEEYKNNSNSKCSVNSDNELLLEFTTNDSYDFNKKLYIDKETAKPLKLIIQDINKKTLVYILYTDIEISK